MYRISQAEGGVNGRARSSPAKVPIWSWTDAVARADMPPLCKLVLLNIGRHLSQVGGKGWPMTIKQMQKETGLSTGSLAKYIDLAQSEDVGLLDVVRQHDSHGHRTTTVYIARLPEGRSGDPQRCEPEADPSARDASRDGNLNARDALRLDARGEGLDASGDSLSAPDAPQESSQSFQASQPATPPNLFKPGAGDWVIPGSGTDVAGILAEGKKAAQTQRNGGKEPERLPFTRGVLLQVQMLGVNSEQLVQRYFERTKGKRIADPTAYLLTMARDEAAKREGAPAEIVKHATSSDPKIRALAQAAVVSEGPRQLADVLAELGSHVRRTG